MTTTTPRTPTVLVTGATGNAGCAAVKALAKTGRFNVRAGVRRGSSRITYLDSISGVTAVAYDADIHDADLDNAFRDVNYVYLVPPSTSTRMVQFRNYIAAAQKARVDFIVMFSMLRPSMSRNKYHAVYEQMEAIVEQSGIAYAILRCTMQQQTLFLFTPDIWKNALPLPWGNGRIAPISVVDAAEVVRVIFSEPMKHHRRAYHLTGGELVSANDIALIASNCLGWNVRHIDVSRLATRRLLLDSGLDDWLAEEFLEMFDEIRDGLFETLDTRELVEALTGTPCKSLAEFFNEHQQRFKEYKPGQLPPYGPPEGIIETDATVQMAPVEKLEARVVENPACVVQTTPVETQAPAGYEIVGREEGGRKELDEVKAQLAEARNVLYNTVEDQRKLVDVLEGMKSTESERLAVLIDKRNKICERIEQ